MKVLPTLAALCALALSAPAVAADIAVSSPWARASAPNAPNGACYLEIVNTGKEPDRVVSASSPVADKAELHTHLMDNGVMKMRPVEAFEVAPGEPQVLRPGGNHIMLMGLKQPLKPGASFPVTLTFAKAGAVTVEVPVQEAGAMTAPGAHSMHPGAPAQHGQPMHPMPQGGQHKTN
ncbi:copper chaperone PCu(A)C [Azospirillum sp. TSO22-1]|uniref:copper chaperone PCu(A)C n=1 Tax=Azospirillum sp. TSO22-1 TaxID=716789 RepID=UPI000D65833A|nr:copper chaperone PCu(A)C [Azospirillum sp. TSO22-1]